MSLVVRRNGKNRAACQFNRVQIARLRAVQPNGVPVPILDPHKPPALLFKHDLGLVLFQNRIFALFPILRQHEIVLVVSRKPAAAVRREYRQCAGRVPVPDRTACVQLQKLSVRERPLLPERAVRNRRLRVVRPQNRNRSSYVRLRVVRRFQKEVPRVEVHRLEAERAVLILAEQLLIQLRTFLRLEHIACEQVRFPVQLPARLFVR